MITFLKNNDTVNQTSYHDIFIEAYKFLNLNVPNNIKNINNKDIIKDIPPPTHIKIDVDGNELDVLNALHVYLNSSSLKYIHIEISVNFEAIDSILKNYKFKCIKSIGENYLYEK